MLPAYGAGLGEGDASGRGQETQKSFLLNGSGITTSSRSSALDVPCSTTWPVVTSTQTLRFTNVSSLGTVPAIKYSNRFAQLSFLGPPVVEQISTPVTPLGTLKVSLTLSRRTNVIISFQIGVAPVIPEVI